MILDIIAIGMCIAIVALFASVGIRSGPHPIIRSLWWEKQQQHKKGR